MPVWGWVLAVALILVGLAISYLKPEKVFEWLERCCWGQGKRYESLDEEMKNLALATGA